MANYFPEKQQYTNVFVFPNSQRKITSAYDVRTKRLTLFYHADTAEIERVSGLASSYDRELIVQKVDMDGTKAILLAEYIEDPNNPGLYRAYPFIAGLTSDSKPIDGISNSTLLTTTRGLNNFSNGSAGLAALQLSVNGIPKEDLPPGLLRNNATPAATQPVPSAEAPAAAPAPSAPPAPTPEPAPRPDETREQSPGQGDPQGGPAPVPQQQRVPEQGSTPIPPVAQPANPVEKSYLSYPLNIKDRQDRIRFQAVILGERKEKTPTGSQGALDFRFGDRTFVVAENQKPVYMAIQSSISDQNSVDWGPDSINAIDSALYYKSRNAMEGESDVAAQLGKFGTDIAIAVKERKGFFQRYLAGQAAGNSNILARTDGVVLNPNMELLFQGPQLRPFTFQFKMSARNDKEAFEIRQIIGYFKRNMAVKKNAPGDVGGFFLGSPNLFQISYLKWYDDEKDPQGKITKAGGWRDHPGLNLIHPYNEKNPKEPSARACALTNCSVDYTPLGSYATYSDGAMVAYNISLQFQDVQPVYAEDYPNDHPIGY